MITQLAELLLNAGCNPNVPAPPRVPPLFMAVNMQSPPLVDLLIRCECASRLVISPHYDAAL